MRVLVKMSACQGHARCEDICPEIFGTDDIEGKVIIKVEHVPVELEDKARLAVRNCPEGALRVMNREAGDE